MIDYQPPRTRIVVGDGVHHWLPELMDALGVAGAFVICGGTVSRGPQLALVREALGDRLVGVYNEVRPQGGEAGLRAAAEKVRASGAGVVISLGGGAAIDSAKFVVLTLSARAEVRDHRLRKLGENHQGERAMLESTAVAHIAIPTTTGSSSEVMPSAGIRDAAQSEKVLYRDPLLVPDVAVLDPRFVVDTGPELTATSGATAVARAVEALYSVNGHAFTTAYALQSLRLLTAALPASIQDGTDLAARTDALLGSLLSGIAASGAGAGLTHAVGHAVGGKLALQHGVAHRIVLPHAAKLLLEYAHASSTQLAEALGSPSVDPDLSTVLELLRSLLDSLGTPSRLRDVGVEHADLDDLARRTAVEPMMRSSPRLITEAEIRAMLEDCW